MYFVIQRFLEKYHIYTPQYKTLYNTQYSKLICKYQLQIHLASSIERNISVNTDCSHIVPGGFSRWKNSLSGKWVIWKLHWGAEGLQLFSCVSSARSQSKAVTSDDTTYILWYIFSFSRSVHEVIVLTFCWNTSEYSIKINMFYTCVRTWPDFSLSYIASVSFVTKCLCAKSLITRIFQYCTMSVL